MSNHGKAHLFEGGGSVRRLHNGEDRGEPHRGQPWFFVFPSRWSAIPGGLQVVSHGSLFPRGGRVGQTRIKLFFAGATLVLRNGSVINSLIELVRTAERQEDHSHAGAWERGFSGRQASRLEISKLTPRRS